MALPDDRRYQYSADDRANSAARLGAPFRNCHFCEQSFRVPQGPRAQHLDAAWKDTYAARRWCSSECLDAEIERDGPQSRSDLAPLSFWRQQARGAVSSAHGSDRQAPDQPEDEQP